MICAVNVLLVGLAGQWRCDRQGI